MIYKKVKLEFDDAKERLTRTLLIKENANLVIVGAIFCSALRTEFEHCFYFLKNKVHYSPDVFIAEGLSDIFEEVPMKNYKLKDMGTSFKFIYDTGENWEFNCKVSKEEVKIKGNKLAYLVDGKGQGVWEDNKCSLMAYINGEIDLESDEEDERKGYYLPWNFDNSKYGDFDNYDIEEAKEYFDSYSIRDINRYLIDAHSYGFELKIKLLKDTVKRRAELYTSFGQRKDVEDLVITKTKTDLLSSLKAINEEYAKKFMEENCFDNYREWKSNVLIKFKTNLRISKNNISTMNFFNKLVYFKDTTTVVAYADDVTSNVVFLYRDDDGLKYYIPDEIKKVIKKELPIIYNE